MFKSARIKLTGWYLLLIALISVIFSLAIYTSISRELERGFRVAEMRLREDRRETFPPRPLLPPREINPQLVEEFSLAKKRLALNLLMINGIILSFSAAAGYFLAGKTLKPIEKTMEEQKRFIADASHELRTPLTSLKASVEIALREKKMTSQEAKRVLASNLEDIDSLQSLTDNLLSLDQYQQANNNFVYEPVDIDEIFRSVQRKISPLAKKKNIKMNLKTSNQIAQVNQNSLEKLIMLLLDNAIKFTPKGGKIEASANIIRKKLIIKVKDNGIGISKEDLPYVFDRFYRVDQSRCKVEAPGFGLGLSLAKKIVEAHRGAIEVKSNPGKGTVFTVKLSLKHA